MPHKWTTVSAGRGEREDAVDGEACSVEKAGAVKRRFFATRKMAPHFFRKLFLKNGKTVLPEAKKPKNGRNTFARGELSSDQSWEVG